MCASRLALVVLLFSGCGFFLPLEPDPPLEDDGGVVFDSDAGTEDAGMLAHGIDPVTCTFRGHKLFGHVQYVDSFPDVKVRVVTSLPDFRVQSVSSLATRCGEWIEDNSSFGLRVKRVDSFADLDIKYVTSFPGLP